MRGNHYGASISRRAWANLSVHCRCIKLFRSGRIGSKSTMMSAISQHIIQCKKKSRHWTTVFLHLCNGTFQS
jgi:hypothetical protein